MLDPHGLYLPDREESINANLWDAENECFHRALDVWPDTIAPFVAVTEACADAMPRLELPGAGSPEADDQDETVYDSSPSGPRTPDKRKISATSDVAKLARQCSGLARPDSSMLALDSGPHDGAGVHADAATSEVVAAAGELPPQPHSASG